MADLKGKLVNPKDHKTVEEGLKAAVSKSMFDVGFENLTTAGATGLIIGGDPPSQAEAEAIIAAVDSTNAKLDAVITALKALGVNINGS